MALKLTIPPCIHDPAHAFHPPPVDRPLRVQIEGDLKCFQKLVPDCPWRLDINYRVLPRRQPAAEALARLTYQALYNTDPREPGQGAAGGGGGGDMVVRHDFLSWRKKWPNIRLDPVDYYGVVFDHLVPSDDPDPEVLQINIVEMDFDEGTYVDAWLLFQVDPAKYTGSEVLAVPRCCQKRKGTTDRARVNGQVAEEKEASSQQREA